MKKSHVTPFVIRPIGFSGDERTELNRYFVLHHKQGGTAFHLMHEDDLLDPDLYLANADAPGSLPSLERLKPAPARPALVLGSQYLDLPHLFLLSPVDKSDVLGALEKLVGMRADALARLPASRYVQVPERRRLLPPEPMPEALRLRRPPPAGGVLVVDRDPDLANHIARLLAPRRLRVDRANEQRSAVILCKQFPVSLVIVNTATPGLDPYKLCEAIKTQSAGGLRVVFIVGRYFSYVPEMARAVGCEGFVNRQIAERQLDSLLRRYLPVEMDEGAGGGVRRWFAFVFRRLRLVCSVWDCWSMHFLNTEDKPLREEAELSPNRRRAITGAFRSLAALA